jgi:hypothetical protein
MIHTIPPKNLNTLQEILGREEAMIDTLKHPGSRQGFGFF